MVNCVPWDQCSFMCVCARGVYSSMCREMKSMNVLICNDNRSIMLIPVTEGTLTSVRPLVISHLIVYFGRFVFSPLLACVNLWMHACVFLYCGGLKILTEFECNLLGTACVCLRACARETDCVWVHTMWVHSISGSLHKHSATQSHSRWFITRPVIRLTWLSSAPDYRYILLSVEHGNKKICVQYILCCCTSLCTCVYECVKVCLWVASF